VTIIPLLTQRADSAADSAGLTPFSITARIGSVLVQGDPGNQWTVAQAMDVAKAFGVKEPAQTPYPPTADRVYAFSSVGGVTGDGITVSVHCALGPDAKEVP
jgi:hypothetical protein